MLKNLNVRDLPSGPNIVQHSYPQGYFTLKKNIFEMLEEVDIFVPKNERFYPYFTAHDLEAMMKHLEYTQNNKLKWLSKHVPFCVGIYSNIPGYKEPYVYINDDMDDLVTDMTSFLNEIPSKSNMLCMQKWGYVFNKLDEKEHQWKNILSKCKKTTWNMKNNICLIWKAMVIMTSKNNV